MARGENGARGKRSEGKTVRGENGTRGEEAREGKRERGEKERGETVAHDFFDTQINFLGGVISDPE